MRSLTKGLRAVVNGALVLLPVWWNTKDEIVCQLPSELIIVPPSGEQLAALLKLLADRGFHAYGCFNCRYFSSKGGAEEATEGTAGYCLESKFGQNVTMGDLVATVFSCDAYRLGTEDERKTEHLRWTDSIRDRKFNA